ncbi:MAG: hypothetical protein ABS95_02910 [Verrucomicrobia bacterium SCN 57-15]|nr:MAG: hypothetical protein ABS95_02910 [Verrucomicrobia bacterium SCN 57-15]
MKTIRIAACDWLETEFSVPVVKAMPRNGKERGRSTPDGGRVNSLFARKTISSARAETTTALLVLRVANGI